MNFYYRTRKIHRCILFEFCKLQKRFVYTIWCSLFPLDCSLLSWSHCFILQKDTHFYKRDHWIKKTVEKKFIYLIKLCQYGLLKEGGDPNVEGRDGSLPLMVCLVPLVNRDHLHHFTHRQHWYKWSGAGDHSWQGSPGTPPGAADTHLTPPQL